MTVVELFPGQGGSACKLNETSKSKKRRYVHTAVQGDARYMSTGPFFVACSEQSGAWNVLTVVARERFYRPMLNEEYSVCTWIVSIGRLGMSTTH